ncbi:hypothetical protein Bca4012_023411 [Brassica carinata]
METHHHLFFECSYSWNAFASEIWTNPPADLHSVAAWIQSPRHRSSYNASTLTKLLFQSIIYVIWKKRNARIFTSVASPTPVLHLSLDLGIGCCLFQQGRLPSRLCSSSTSPPIGLLEAFDSFEAINDLSVSHLPAKRDCLMLFMLHIFIHHIFTESSSASLRRKNTT